MGNSSCVMLDLYKPKETSALARNQGRGRKHSVNVKCFALLIHIEGWAAKLVLIGCVGIVGLVIYQIFKYRLEKDDEFFL